MQLQLMFGSKWGLVNLINMLNLASKKNQAFLEMEKQFYPRD